MKTSPQAYDVVGDGRTARYALANFTPEEFQRFWPGVEKMFDAVPHTWRYWTKEYIYHAALSGTIQVWGIGPPPDAVFIFFTQVVIHPAMQVLNVTWGAGHFDEEMIPLIHATLMNYAKMNACTEISVIGRPGWDPMLKAIGMKREHVTWTLPVPDMRLS